MPRVEIIVALCVVWLPCCALASVNHSSNSLCVLFFFIFLLSLSISHSLCWFTGWLAVRWASASSLSLKQRCVSIKLHSMNVYVRSFRLCYWYVLYSVQFDVCLFTSAPFFIWFGVSVNRLLLFVLWKYELRRIYMNMMAVCRSSLADASTIVSISICNWNEKRIKKTSIKKWERNSR